jgi:hypothetical protein
MNLSNMRRQSVRNLIGYRLNDACRHSRGADPVNHVTPARSIFSNALNFCRSAIAVLVRSP